MAEHDHLGIMHEVYAAPAGAWENINVNFVPFGMGEFWIFLSRAYAPVEYLYNPFHSSTYFRI